VPKPELPHCGVVNDYSRDNPRLKFADGGRLVKVSYSRSPAREWNDEQFFRERGVRGKCKGFSFGSRRRMLDSLNTVSVASALPYFLTFTFPDDVFDDDVARFAVFAKVCMDSLIKRLVRVCPQAAGFWRIEWKARESGKHIGKLVPHFHLLVWGLPERKVSDSFLYDDDGFGSHVSGQREDWEAFVNCKDDQLHFDLVTTLATRQAKPKDGHCEVEHKGRKLVFAGSRQYVERCKGAYAAACAASIAEHMPSPETARSMSLQDWGSLAWYHIVDSHNTDHFTAGFRCEKVESWGGVMSYCAKYMAKTDSGFLSEVHFGRSWGIFNRKSVPWARLIEVDLEPEVGNRLRRIARRYMEHKRGKKVRSPYGFTLYCDITNWKRLWQALPPPDPF
jgi:hypothetical protein